MTTDKINIIGLTRKELADHLKEIGLEAFRAKQIWHWVYTKGATDFERMTTIAKDQQKLLGDHFVVGRPQIVKDLVSFDGTRKWLLEYPDGNKIETVFIPEEDRGALCVSSQVGCTLTCTFCHTGTMPLVRNLRVDEIVGQALMARDGLNEWGKKREDCLFTNIVMMGMGEPLYNYDNVAMALKIAMDGEGIAISKRRITLSTSGVVPNIARAGSEIGTMLAISLHAVTDTLRD
jgi:23S rRNA (adenine2503-C2)-methyltransferase